LKIRLGSLEVVLRSLSSIEAEAIGFLLGLKAGSSIDVMALYRVDNELGSPVEFRANPWQTVQAHNVADKYGVEVVALFHTHPTCPPVPSSLDFKGMKLWPIPWVIACKDEVKAWILEGEKVKEVGIE